MAVVRMVHYGRPWIDRNDMAEESVERQVLRETAENVWARKWSFAFVACGLAVAWIPGRPLKAALTVVAFAFLLMSRVRGERVR
jgi:hypothetical protein